MFEQALMSTTRNKPWTLGASITLQSAIVGTLVLYSALHVDTLPLITKFDICLPPHAPKLDAIKVFGASMGHSSGALTLSPRPFTMPRTIPDGVPEINDIGAEAPALPFTSASLGTGNGIGVIGG